MVLNGKLKRNFRASYVQLWSEVYIREHEFHGHYGGFSSLNCFLSLEE